MSLTVQDLLHQDAKIQDLYFNISEMKLSITSLYIISDAPKYDIIWTENSDVIDSFNPKILAFKACSKRVQHVTNKFSFSVQIMSYLGASDRPIK